ncbi:MAG: site-2 protease family protein [Ruminococcus sp.]|nr:site-2 protease family protein [Ruminococcus sp.]
MSRVRVGFSFLLFNGLLFLFFGGKMIFSFYSVCLLHELGHLATLRLTGGELRRAELSFFGIRMVAAPAADIGRGAVVLLSGPAANLLLYAVLTALGCGGITARLSLAAGVFNLLPFSGLDGGALLDMLAEGRPCERQLRTCLTVVRAALAVGLAALAVADIAKT